MSISKPMVDIEMYGVEPSCHARRSASFGCCCVAKEIEGRLSAEDSVDHPLGVAARNVAWRRRPKLPMSRSSAERRRTPEKRMPPGCSATLSFFVRGKRRKGEGRQLAPSLFCFSHCRRTHQRKGRTKEPPCQSPSSRSHSRSSEASSLPISSEFHEPIQRPLTSYLLPAGNREGRRSVVTPMATIAVVSELHQLPPNSAMAEAHPRPSRMLN
nr:hypothetical protein Iba_chr05aCG9520 [Ipomoea batatas]